MVMLRLVQLNDVKLVGRLTRDPEMRFTGKGMPICRFDLAINRRFRDATGEWKDDTSYVPVVAWNEIAQRCNDRLKKGHPVYVEGRLKSRAWETKDGQKRVSLEVVSSRIQFLAKAEGEKTDAPGEEAMPGSEMSAPDVSIKESAGEVEAPPISAEEEIPF